MTVEAIISRILQEAEEQIDEIRNEESCEVSNIRIRAEQKAEEAYNHRMAEGMREIRQYIAGQQSKARIEAKRTTRAAREDLIRQCFDGVSRYLKNIRNDERYPLFLKNLLMECVQNLGRDELLISVHPDDRSYAESLIRELMKEGYRLRLSDVSLKTGGGVICERIADKVTIDNTVEARFDRMEREMIVTASETLFSER